MWSQRSACRVGGMHTKKHPAGAHKEGVAPKTSPFSERQNTCVTQGISFCTKVWCISICSYKSQGITLGNVTLNYYLFFCAGHIHVWDECINMLGDYLKSVQSGVCMLCSLSHKFSYELFFLEVWDQEAYDNIIGLYTEQSHPASMNSQNVEEFASFIMPAFQYRQLAAELNS